MYETFFGLRCNPFLMTPAPDFLAVTASNREALAGLLYALQARRGIMVLTGDAGTGKTTLLNLVLRSKLADEIETSYIFNPTLTPTEFLEAIMLDFGIDHIPESKPQRLRMLQEFLLKVYEQGRTAVVVIDEAHTLAPNVLEEVRLLTNFESPTCKLLQVVLAGQTELDLILNRNELRQLRQRIVVRLSISPLSDEEIAPYLQHRWTKAGGTQELPFDGGAVRLITQLSRGIPRIINGVCDNVLLAAFSAGLRTVGADQVAEVGRDLHLMPTLKMTDAHKNGHAAMIDSNGKVEPTIVNGSAPPVSPIGKELADLPFAETTSPAIVRYVPPTGKLPPFLRMATKLGFRVEYRPLNGRDSF